MPTSYPGAIDSLTNPTAGSATSNPDHALQHSDINDGMEAVQTELGTNPSGGAATVAARFTAAEGALTTHEADKTVVHGFADTDKVPRGVLGYSQVTADQGSITTEVDLTSLSSAVTALASRRLKITGSVRFASTVVNDRVDLRIFEGGTQLQARAVALNNANASEGVEVFVYITPSVGAHTYKLTATRVTGTGTITMGASATTPAFIVVEDVGAA
jgi:hypothetical protein